MSLSDPQTRIVLIEFARRAVALVLFIAAATAGLGYGQSWLAIVMVLAGIAVYVLVPRPKPPAHAVHHERMPSVHMPDFLGFMLATLFFALPLIVSAQEPWLGGPWGLFLMTGLPGLIALFIFWIAIRHQCMWLRVTGHDLTIADMGGVTSYPFAEIAEVSAETRPPPAWLKPLLILFGGWRGLGIALVSDRASHAVIVVKRDGSRHKVPTDAFPDMRKVLVALDHGGVHLDANLHEVAVKAGRHRRAHKPAKHGHADGSHAKPT